jgi:hypothetical protein
MHYTVIVGSREVVLDNLSLVYGFLCGRFEDYPVSYAAFKRFKKWLRENRKKGNPPFTLYNESCQIIPS